MKPEKIEKKRPKKHIKINHANNKPNSAAIVTYLDLSKTNIPYLIFSFTDKRLGVSNCHVNSLRTVKYCKRTIKCNSPSHHSTVSDI